MKSSNFLLAAAALAAALAMPGKAHHSFAMFDQTKTVSLKGKVVEFQWTNPHAFIELEVPNGKGGVDRWSVELNSPNNLSRQGWRRSSVKPGETVTIALNPLRNGKKGGLFNTIVLANGSMLGGERGANGRGINVPTAD